MCVCVVSSEFHPSRRKRRGCGETPALPSPCPVFPHPPAHLARPALSQAGGDGLSAVVNADEACH